MCCRRHKGLNQMRLFLLVAMLVSGGTLAHAEISQDLKTARKDFQVLCAPCHGVEARGDGPAAAALKTRPADLTGIARRHGGTFPEELIIEVIQGLNMPTAHGIREMPIWGDVFVSEAIGTSVSIEDAKRAAAEVEQRIRHLVKYLETIQRER
jgi:hypothetical protein